jgi:hypothetical protein
MILIPISPHTNNATGPGRRSSRLRGPREEGMTGVETETERRRTGRGSRAALVMVMVRTTKKSWRRRRQQIEEEEEEEEEEASSPHPPRRCARRGTWATAWSWRARWRAGCGRRSRTSSSSSTRRRERCVVVPEHPTIPTPLFLFHQNLFPSLSLALSTLSLSLSSVLGFFTLTASPPQPPKTPPHTTPTPTPHNPHNPHNPQPTTSPATTGGAFEGRPDAGRAAAAPRAPRRPQHAGAAPLRRGRVRGALCVRLPRQGL